MSLPFRHDEDGADPDAWSRDPAWGAIPDLDLVGSDGRPATRLVVVAAHPDDESLGAGGLLATAHDQGLLIDLVLLTRGEHSHPGSTTHDPARLADLRGRESEMALRLVAAAGRTTRLGLEDGRVAGREAEVTTLLVDLVEDGRSTIIAAPWRRDGHPDHEAAGRAAAAAALRTGARLLEYPVWFWHWGTPDQAPWASLQRLPLSERHRDLKRRAVRAHETQVRPLSELPGDETLLSPRFLARFDQPQEVFVEEPVVDDALDALHQDEAEPWEVDDRWFEQRKRALSLAMLPGRTYRRGLELGCSTGALAADLAQRCEELVAVDSSPAAVASARRRLAAYPGVEVQQRELPRDWPDGTFDLVVVSEVGYFLSPRDVEELVRRVDAALPPDGVIVLCHWRHPVEGWVLDGPRVHQIFRDGSTRPEWAHYVDDDVEISVLAPAAARPPANA